MRLFGSDSDSLQNAASLDTLVDINNTDDGPEWSALPNVTLKEDQSAKAIVDLSGYVSDIDTPMTSLSYSIVSQTGISYGYVRQEDSDRSKLDYESRLPNWYGEVRVVVQVASQNYTEQNGFTIVVEPVNDLPSVEIRYPVEGGRIESGKEISIAGMADDVEGIQKVEVYFEGKWVKAIGQNFWGTTLIVPEVREATVNGIEVRATDTDGVVVYSYVNVTVVPREVEVNPDTDGDGVDDIFDDFDLDPSEWKDSDLDGMGDNSDLWPHVKGWTVDTDGDGYADPADYRAYDANIWEESQVIETPGGEGGKGEGSGGVSIVPILLWLIAVLMVIAAVMSFVAYRGKRKASRDPKMSVAYVKRREARKERLARALGFAHLDRFLTSMQLKDLEAQRMTHPAPAVYQMPNPSMRGPMQAGAIQPVQAYPSLPPHMQMQMNQKNGRYPK